MRAIVTEKAPKAIGTYSQAIQWNNLVFLSGQIPLDPVTMEIVSTKFDEQLDQVFKNLKAVCEASGGALKNIIKLQIYLTDLTNFAKVNALMMQYFSEPFPARAVVGVKELPKQSLVEIDAIMTLPYEGT